MEKTSPVPRAAHAARSGKNKDHDTAGSNQRSQFFSLAVDMSWKLAAAVLVPVLAGVWLDKKFSTTPVLTLVGLGLAVVASGAVMWRTMQTANKLPVPKLTDEQRRKIRKSYEEDENE